MTEETATLSLETLWNDAEELEKLKTSPKNYLNSHGADIPDNVEVHAHIDTPTLRNFVLPPDGTEIPEGDNPMLKIIRHALSDSSYKARLLANPKAVLADEGVIELADSVEVSVHQNTASDVHVVIPLNPAHSELSETELEAVAGGGALATTCDVASVAGGVICAVALIPTFGVSVVPSVIGYGGITAVSLIGHDF